MPKPPKPPGHRRRRNKDQSKWQDLPAARRGRRPALPRKKPTWLKLTREWWDAIWASPMATAWLPADVPVLVRLARIIEADNRGEATAALLSEARQIEDRFGLSPRSRRMLQWQIGPSPGRQEPEAEKQPKGKKLASVHRLRAVDG